DVVRCHVRRHVNAIFLRDARQIRRGKHRRAALIRGGNDLQRFRRERRVHATRPGGRGHARLEFSEKLVHCGTRYRVPTRVTKIRRSLRKRLPHRPERARVREAQDHWIEAAASTELAKPGDYRSASTLRTLCP